MMNDDRRGAWPPLTQEALDRVREAENAAIDEYERNMAPYSPGHPRFRVNPAEVAACRAKHLEFLTVLGPKLFNPQAEQYRVIDESFMLHSDFSIRKIMSEVFERLIALWNAWDKAVENALFKGSRSNASKAERLKNTASKLALHKILKVRIQGILSDLVTEWEVHAADRLANAPDPDGGPDVEADSARKGKPRPYRFDTPVGTTWSDIVIRFHDGHTVAIEIDGNKRVRNFAEMNMKNHRNGNPTKQWQLLESLANDNGLLSWTNSGANSRMKKRVELLAHCLQEYFNISESPFHKYQKGSGWRIKLRLEPYR